MAKHKVLLLGAGKIGRMIAKFLLLSGDYDVTVGDASSVAIERLKKQTDVPCVLVDASQIESLLLAMKGCDSVLSALSFSVNPMVAQAAALSGANYFDLTEDIETTRKVRSIATEAKQGQIFMPQCGLAPGFVSILAHHLTQQLDSLDTVHMRVGALPEFPTNAMKYNLTWSTIGLINEYCNPCEVIHESKRMEVLPLEGLEHFSLDGIHYEAFNTSGGLGTLCETLEGRVRELNYKTCRYLGHRDLMMFLLNELRMNQRREQLVEIMESSVPITFQDVVIVFCSVKGQRKHQFVQLNDARRVYHHHIDGEAWSAIQITTAASLCAVVDLHREGKLPHKGFVRQEDVKFDDFITNRFGKYYQANVRSHIVPS